MNTDSKPPTATRTFGLFKNLELRLANNPFERDNGVAGLSDSGAGFSWTNASTPASMVVPGAVTYSPSPRLVLDGGAYVSVYGNLPRVVGFVGFTYAISDLYYPHAARRSAGN